MTVIQPNKNKTGFLKTIFMMSVMVFGLLATEIWIYSQTVNLKHDIISLDSKLDALRLENAELKNRFYNLTDKSSFDALAKDRGLIEDKNPKWVFVSQL